MWVDVEPAHPPAWHIIAIYSDCSGAVPLTKFDEHPYLHGEDGYAYTDADIRKLFSKWAAAPEGFSPRFLQVTEDAWR